MSDRETEIRTPQKSIRLGTWAGWCVKLLSKTLRYEYVGDLPPDRPVLIALWHNTIFVAPAGFRRQYPDVDVTVLTSASKDGAILEYAMRVGFGFKAIRGSSSRRGARALIELKRLVDGGNNACITPDGPRGPVHEVQPGIIKLASLTGAPIIPLFIDAPNCWVINTWDGFKIPIPFSKVSIHYRNSLFIPRNLSDEEMANYQEQLKGLMCNAKNPTYE